MAKKTATKKKSKTSLGKLNETGTRKVPDRRKASKATAKAKAKSTSKTITKKPTEEQPERRKTKRRRQIDPTTCEREYNNAEIEFMHALDEYKRASGRMFPTCSEILEVIKGLGYRQVAEATEGFSFEKDNDSNETYDDGFDTESLENELESQIV